MSETGSDFRARQYEFAAHLRDPEKFPAPADVEDRRMKIYRDLFFNNISTFLANSYPILAAQLGKERWAALVRDFFRDHRSVSPLFPQVSREFLNYLADEREANARAEADPQFMYELAHYEWVETALRLADDPDGNPVESAGGDLLDNRPVLSPLAWAMSYRWPVSEFTKESCPDREAPEPQHHLVYRNAEGRIKYAKLNAVSARLYQLLDGEAPLTGREALETIAGELQHPEPDKVVASGLQILEKWRQLGVITGTLDA